MCFLLDELCKNVVLGLLLILSIYSYVLYLLYMPRFIDLFVSELRRSSGRFRELAGFREECRGLYECFCDYWLGLPNLSRFDGDVFCVDSSDGVIELGSGVAVHVCRGLGLSRKGVEVRRLAVNYFYAPARRVDLVLFRGRFREHLEHLVALEYLEKGYSGVVVLDGSLYGRTIHLPKDTGVPGYQGFIVDYIDVLSRLFSESFKRGVPILGLAKDSRSRIFGNFLLFEELKRRLSRIDAESSLRNMIIELWFDVHKNPRAVFQRLQKIADKERALEPVLEIFREAAVKRPDVKIVMEMAQGAGFTRPLLLGIAKPLLNSLVDALLSNALEDYVRKNFSQALAENPDFLSKALRVLPKVLEYPAIFSFYVIFEKGDLPLRVDVPSWVLGVKLNMGDTFDPVIELDWNALREILSLFYSLYGGPKHYNVLMEEVDSKVKITSETLVIYERTVEKELGILVRHTRDVSRVRFP